MENTLGNPKLEIKQVIVYRRDLQMRKGKIAAQVAHASMKVFFDRNIRFVGPDKTPHPLVAVVVDDVTASGSGNPHQPIHIPTGEYLLVPLTPEMVSWSFGTFGKIVLSVENEADLLKLYEEAKARGIPTALITDLGRTEFHGVPTHTTVAIGPALSDEIDPITGPGGLVETKLA